MAEQPYSPASLLPLALPTGALDKQPEALKTTAPSFSFSQLDREQASGPRPASVPPVGSYDSPSAFGEQVESSRQSPQRMRFSRTTREQAQRVLISSRQLTSQLGTQGTDPGQYPLPAAIGPQPSSQRPTMPAFSLPRKDRLQNEFERLGKTLPAPGSYETWKSIGKQALSANRTLPSFGFGTSTWAGSEEKRFISSAHTRLMKGMESPANYDHQTPAMQVSRQPLQMLCQGQGPDSAGPALGARSSAREAQASASALVAPGSPSRPQTRQGPATMTEVIKVPEGAVLRGCKKTRRKLREHLRLRAEIHSQLRFIASLFVLRIFLTCLVGYPTPGFPSAPQPPAVQPPQPPNAPALPPLPPRAPAQPAPAQPASMECDNDSDSESDYGSEPEPQSDSESESEPEPVPQRRCSARLAALAPAAPTGPPMPLDCEDPVMLRQLKDFCKFFANPNFKTCYNQLQRRHVRNRHPSTPPPAKRSKPAAEPTKGNGKAHGKAARAKPAPQPGRWLDRDCNAALNMQRIGESRWRPLELCFWPDQGALPAKGKEYPGLGYKRLRDKPPKAQEQQQQPAEAHAVSSMNGIFEPMIKAGSVLVYLDDILVMTNTPEEHVQHLRQVLELMRAHKLFAKLSKCEFNRPELAFLGHITVIKVPEGAVLRGCKKTRRKLREHLRLRAEIHSQLRFIASLFVLRIFLTCLVGYPTPGFPSAPQPPAVQPPQPPNAPALPPLPLRAPAQPAPAQPASMEFDTDSDSESDCGSEPEPQSDSESESEPEPSRWRPLELCFWPDQGALPAKGKEYPGLGYKRLRDKPPKAQEQQQQPAEAQ
ncbi:hypothetical protein QJQ45_025725 [Haematococcus lacustris]|nr:hypothetical protein QJQ45_025725 [Haematococcus lacustris]